MRRARLSETPARPADPTHFTEPGERHDLIAVEHPRSTGILVRFGPGGRTHWHAHPDGQYLYVLEGEGRIQRRGGAVETMVPGDMVYAEPGEEHWHGAAADAAVAHLAFSFGPTEWGTEVSEDEGEAGR